MMSKNSRGNMSLEARRKKKEKLAEREKRLRCIKARALKKMGGRTDAAPAEFKRPGKNQNEGKGNSDAASRSPGGQGQKRRSKSLGDVTTGGRDARAHEKGDALKIKQKKVAKSKLMYKKTRRGQPVMRHKIEDILSKLKR